jgi:hypothetical protein
MQLVEEILSAFDVIVGDGKVTFEEFCEYYKDISSKIENDDFFELMIRNSWHIAGGKGLAENTINKR